MVTNLQCPFVNKMKAAFCLLEVPVKTCDEDLDEILND